jgi:translation initiation factor IF-3
VHHLAIEDDSDIPDYSKLVYERQRAAKQQQKAARADQTPTKEIHLRVGISAGDFQGKVAQARAFLGEGANVRASVELASDEQLEVARELAERFSDAARDIAAAVVPPQDGDAEVVVVMCPPPA